MERLENDPCPSEMAQAMKDGIRRREAHLENERTDSSGIIVIESGPAAEYDPADRKIPAPGHASHDLEERFWEAVDAAIGAHLVHD